MSDRTTIEWTDSTWAPVTGCSKVSPGCDNCYAASIAHRFNGTKAWPNGFDVALWPERLDIPLRWRKPRKVFVCSTGDLFHDQVPDKYIAKVFGVMCHASHHTFQVLTKRHARMRSLLSSDDFRELVFKSTNLDPRSPDGTSDVLSDYWPLPNVWLGVSTENQQWANIRIPALLDTPAAVRFISAEPLLGPINLHTDPIEAGAPFWGSQLDWVIVGGESGPGARPMHPRWAETLHRQCETAGVAFTFKQWGTWTPLAPLKAGRFDFSAGIAMTDDGNTYQRGDLDWPDGPRRGEAMRADFPHHNPTSMYRVGKKNAGRELYHDGRTFDQYPEQVTV